MNRMDFWTLEITNYAFGFFSYMQYKFRNSFVFVSYSIQMLTVLTDTTRKQLQLVLPACDQKTRSEE